MALHIASHIDATSIAQLPEQRTADPRDVSPDEGNRQRAIAAAAALRAYGAQTTLRDDTPATALMYLLGDLRHLCDALGLDFSDLLDQGRLQYLDELMGSPAA